MPPKLLKKVPPRRDIDHRIKLESRTKPSAPSSYWLIPPEPIIHLKQFNNLLDADLFKIQNHDLPWQYSYRGSKMEVWLYMDYQVVNKMMVRNRYLIPLIIYIFNQLGKAKYYSKLDQIWILTSLASWRRHWEDNMCDPIWIFWVFGHVIRLDECTYYILYIDESTIPPFREHLNKFMVVYLDDIMVYSQNLESMSNTFEPSSRSCEGVSWASRRSNVT